MSKQRLVATLVFLGIGGILIAAYLVFGGKAVTREYPKASKVDTRPWQELPKP